jgi:hypothetical protein
MATGVQLAVLNPGGRDREQLFPDGAGTPGEKVPHPPVNYHAYAACTRGGFYADPARIPVDHPCVLLVLRRDFAACLKALRLLKSKGKKVAVTLKESGLHQVAQVLEEANRLSLFREICATADGCLASTPNLVNLYEAAGGRHVKFIPTPYPVGSPDWDFSVPVAQRRGVFIGTREWNVPSRNHAAALMMAANLDVPVTVVNEDGRAGRKRIESSGLANPQIIEGRTPYPEYLKLIAGHRIVLQLDRSAVPGQVAGDALLCRLPCVGGDGAIERTAFPDSSGFGRECAELREIARSLLRDDTAYEAALTTSEKLAGERLSYPVIAKQLETYFSSL